VEVIAPPDVRATGAPVRPAIEHPDSRGAARVRAFRMVRDLQDGVAVSGVAIDEFITEAERRGWSEVVRAGLFVHVVKAGLFAEVVKAGNLDAAARAREAEDNARLVTVTRLLERAEGDGDAVMTALALATRALAWTSDDPASSVSANADIARASVLLEDADGGALERVTAHNACGLAYSQRDLWELETQSYSAAEQLLGDCHDEAALPSVILFNRAEAQLNWAAALREVGDFEALALRCRSAREALALADIPAMPTTWRQELPILQVLLDAIEGTPPSVDIASLPASVVEGGEYGGHLHLGLALSAAEPARAADQAEQAVAAIDAVRHPTQYSLALCVAAEIEARATGGETAGMRSARWQARLRWIARLSALAAMRSLVQAERLAAEHELLTRQAYLDDLTGLGNRRALLRYADGLQLQEITQVAIVQVDVDHFKAVNDRYGHGVGDDTLVRLAGVLRAAVRTADLAVRLGGDEFVVLLASASSETAFRKAEAIKLSIAAEPWAELGTDLNVTVSMGVASGEVRLLAALKAEADAALYLSKAAGGNRVS
jgi:diguanylate cyclase (GGDEF)-like protein